MRQMLTYLLLILIIICSLVASGEELNLDWSIVSKKGEYYLENRGLKFKYNFKFLGGTPHIISAKTYQQNRRYHIIEYYAGNAGTSKIVHANMMLIFDSKEKKVAIDYFSKRWSNEDGKEILDDIEWTFSPNKIVIHDGIQLSEDMLINL